jgi:hypothetical protein
LFQTGGDEGERKQGGAVLYPLKPGQLIRVHHRGSRPLHTSVRQAKDQRGMNKLHLQLI